MKTKINLWLSVFILSITFLMGSNSHAINIIKFTRWVHPFFAYFSREEKNRLNETISRAVFASSVKKTTTNKGLDLFENTSMKVSDNGKCVENIIMNGRSVTAIRGTPIAYPVIINGFEQTVIVCLLQSNHGNFNQVIKAIKGGSWLKTVE